MERFEFKTCSLSYISLILEENHVIYFFFFSLTFALTEGRTGVPFVDANMRELALTGFMSNRGRQNVASFLTKDLGLDWRLGAEWFEYLLVRSVDVLVLLICLYTQKIFWTSDWGFLYFVLNSFLNISVICKKKKRRNDCLLNLIYYFYFFAKIDHDVCSNYGNWLYSAGIGNDPRENRKFNMIKQALDYDHNVRFKRSSSYLPFRICLELDTENLTRTAHIFEVTCFYLIMRKLRVMLLL